MKLLLTIILTPVVFFGLLLLLRINPFFNLGDIINFIASGYFGYLIAAKLAQKFTKPNPEKEAATENKHQKFYEGKVLTREDFADLFYRVDSGTGEYDKTVLKALSQGDKNLLKLCGWLYVEKYISQGDANDYVSNTEYHQGFSASVKQYLFVLYDKAKEQSTGERFKIIKDVMEGSAAWLTLQDVESGKTLYGNNEDGALRLGVLEEGVLLSYKGEGSLITAGGQGSGKTQGQVLPNLLYYYDSMVVLDIKGDCYRQTAEYRKHVLGHKIIRFTPFDTENSHYYNPMAFIRQDKKYFWEDVREAANLFLVDSGKDDYWNKAARELLQGIISYLAIAEGENATIEGILDILGSKFEAGEDEAATDWEIFMRGLKNSIQSKAMQRCANSIESVKEEAPKQFLGVKDSLKAHMADWQGGNLEEVTKRSDWHPEDFRKEKITLYITIPADKVDQYGGLMRVFIAQHINALLREEPEHGNKNEVLFMLDEFHKMGTIPEVQKGLEIGRSYGVRFWVFLQSIDQLDDLYDNANVLLDNFYIQSYLDFPDDTAQKLSRKLGSSDGTLQASNKPLLSTQEMQTDFNNQMIVIGKGNKAAKLKKLVYYSQFADKAASTIEKAKAGES